MEKYPEVKKEMLKYIEANANGLSQLPKVIKEFRAFKSEMQLVKVDLHSTT